MTRTVTRVNLSLPSGLVDLMRDRPEVNWSAVARAAFEAEVFGRSLAGEVAGLCKKLRMSGTRLRRIASIAKEQS